jgi:hypothetical protein
MKVENKILNQKLELIQWLSTVEDKSIIEKLIEFKEKENKDWWDSLSENEKQSLDKGIFDADNGNLKPHSSVKKMYEKWV